jgi:hypothetical protein
MALSTSVWEAAESDGRSGAEAPPLCCADIAWGAAGLRGGGLEQAHVSETTSTTDERRNISSIIFSY